MVLKFVGEQGSILIYLLIGPNNLTILFLFLVLILVYFFPQWQSLAFCTCSNFEPARFEHIGPVEL